MGLSTKQTRYRPIPVKNGPAGRLHICGTFYFMTTVIDGFSRAVVHGEIREKMEEIGVEAILQRACEKHPVEASRVNTDSIKTYNEERLHSAIGYITPADRTTGLAKAIQEDRDGKLAEAQECRSQAWKRKREEQNLMYTESARSEDKALLRSTLSAESASQTESVATVV